MGIDPTVGECLRLLIYMLLEGIVCETAIVTVIVTNSYSLPGCKMLVCVFFLAGFGRGLICHEVNVPQS